jgi:hypothetical protein
VYTHGASQHGKATGQEPSAPEEEKERNMCAASYRTHQQSRDEQHLHGVVIIFRPIKKFSFSSFFIFIFILGLFLIIISLLSLSVRTKHLCVYFTID